MFCFFNVSLILLICSLIPFSCNGYAFGISSTAWSIRLPSEEKVAIPLRSLSILCSNASSDNSMPSAGIETSTDIGVSPGRLRAGHKLPTTLTLLNSMSLSGKYMAVSCMGVSPSKTRLKTLIASQFFLVRSTPS